MKLHRLLLLAANITVLAGRLAAADVLTVRSDPWMPYNGGPADKPGIVLEILSAVAARAEATVDYAPLGWEDAIAAVSAGQADAVIGATAQDAEGKLRLPAEPIGDMRAGLFVRKDQPWNYERIQSLDGKRLGAIKGYTYWPQFDQYLAEHPAAVTWYEGTDALAQAIAALHEGKIDVFPETVITFLWRAREMGAAGTFRIAYINEGNAIYVAFSPNERGARWAQRFDEGLRALRASGELARLLAKYGMQDWK